MSNEIDALERLGGLLDEGKINRDEFEALKLTVLESGAQAKHPSSAPNAAENPEPIVVPKSETWEGAPNGSLDGANGLGSLSLVLAIALWINASYWALEATMGFDFAFTPFFWGSSGPSFDVITVEDLYPLVLIAAGIIFVVWSYRTHAGLKALGRTGLRHQSHEAVWWWIVPLANFVMPFKVIYEMVRGIVAPLDDAGWRSHGVPLIVPWWVGTFLGGVLVTGFSRSILNTASTLEDWTTGAAAYTLGSATLTVCAVLAVSMTRKTTRVYAAQIRRLSRRDIPSASADQSWFAAKSPQPAAPAYDNQDMERLYRSEYWNP